MSVDITTYGQHGVFYIFFLIKTWYALSLSISVIYQPHNIKDRPDQLIEFKCHPATKNLF
jgi:hypothetical protein